MFAVFWRGPGRLLFAALAAACLTSARAAENPLLADNPQPDSELAALVVNLDYPQQSRMDAMTRVAEQADAASLARRAAWFEGLARNNAAPAVIRSHALSRIGVLHQESPALLLWLRQVVADETANGDWRLAALAQLGDFYAASVPAERTETLRTVREAAERRDGGLAAAALLMLGRLAELDPEAREAAEAGLAAAVGDREAGTEELVSALQLSVELRSAALLPEARRLAADSGRELRLRLAALGLLGELGTAGDEAALAAAGRSSPLLRQAAANALGRLTARQAAE